jgi:acyl dehydratase
VSAVVRPAVGESLPELVIEGVRDEHIQMIALILRDSNPIHFDLDAVRAAGLGERAVNQGGSTMAYVMTMVTTWAGGRGALSSISCRFGGLVVAGDDVVCGGTVTEVAVSAAGSTIATCEVWADVRGGRRAIEGVATVALT